jgi:zinc protease
MRRALPALFSLLVAVGCGGSTTAAKFVRPALGSDAPRSPTPDESFRAKAPGVGKKAAFSPPPISEARLGNGIRVLYVERHDFPVVSLRLVSSHGSDLAPLGVGAMWTRLLFRGPDGDDRGKVWRAFGAHGAEVTADVYDDMSAVALEVLSGDYRRCVELLGDVVRDATFPAKGLDDARLLQLSTIARRSDHAGNLARLALDEALYPLGDRYREPVSGTVEAIRKVTRAQVVAYHRAATDADRLSIAVAGDFEPKAMLAELEKDFGKLPSLAAAPLPKPPPVEKSTAPRIVLIDRPGSTQATVVIGALGVAVEHEDRAAIEVLRARLGAQVKYNLREEHAFTYGASVAAGVFRRPGPVFVESAIDIEHTGEAIAEVLAEIESLRTKPLAGDALTEAIDGAILRVARHFDSTENVAARLAVLGGLGLPAMFESDDVKRLGAVTGADVSRIASTYFSADAVHIIVVGDKKALKAQLDALGDGKVEEEKAPPETSE